MKDWVNWLWMLVILLWLLTIGVNIHTAWQFHKIHQQFDLELRKLEAIR